MSQYTQIIYGVKGAAIHVTLNRPEKRNALGEQIVSELKSALSEAEAEQSARVIVLRGAGKDFCAGADLAQLEKVSRASVLENIDDAAQVAELFLKMRRLKKPIIAAVRGRALAGGAGLASACDLILATRSAEFAYTEVKLGFIPAMVMAIARRNLSEKRAFELLATGKVFSAPEAERLGFINRVCEEADFEREIERFATEVAEVSASAVWLTKRLLYQTDAMSFEQALRAGVESNALARMTPDCQSGIKKFLEKA
jgi:methylglutaconyl-CoA hydratase